MKAATPWIGRVMRHGNIPPLLVFIVCAVGYNVAVAIGSTVQDLYNEVRERV